MADLGRAALKKASASGGQDEKRKQIVIPEGAETTGNANMRPGAVPSALSDALQGIVPSTDAPVAVTALNSANMSTVGDNLTGTMGLDPSISPDWLNFDTAFENFDAVLGSSGADVSMNLLRPFNFDDFGSYEFSR
jgi:hypothetical protein